MKPNVHWIFLSLFRDKNGPDLPEVILILNSQCVKWSEHGERRQGITHFCSKLSSFLPVSFSSTPSPFLTGFERKYLTECAFVCFQMIDFGIWATPLAVHS